MCVGFARWIIYLLCDTGSLFSEKGVYLCLLTGSSVVTLPLDHYALIKQISMELLQRWWSAVGLSVCAMLLGRTEKRGVREVCGMFSWEIVKKRHLHKAKWDRSARVCVQPPPPPHSLNPPGHIFHGPAVGGPWLVGSADRLPIGPD